MNASLLIDVPFNEPEAWAAFDMLHGQIHQTAYLALLRLGKAPTFFPIFGFPRLDNQEYLFEHWLVHQSQARLLGITGIPDLSVSDLGDREQFDNWLQMHAAVHVAENKALSIS